MSLDIRYLTNGKKALYCVTNSFASPVSYEVYESIEDIPKEIRHYAPRGDPLFVGPDSAQLSGFGPIFYPEYEHRCLYKGVALIPCLGPGCAMLTPENPNPQNCKYWKDDNNDDQ